MNEYTTTTLRMAGKTPRKAQEPRKWAKGYLSTLQHLATPLKPSCGLLTGKGA